MHKFISYKNSLYFKFNYYIMYIYDVLLKLLNDYLFYVHTYVNILLRIYCTDIILINFCSTKYDGPCGRLTPVIQDISKAI